MFFHRWLLAFFTVFSLSLPVSAKTYTSPTLADADELLLTSPEKTLSLAQQYLMQSPLQGKRGLENTQGGQGSTQYTPYNTVNALQLTALAYAQLQMPEDALQQIKRAEVVAKANSLIIAMLESQLIHAKIYWHSLRNSTIALQLLDKIEQRLNTFGSNDSQLALIEIQYGLALQRGIIESSLDNENSAEQYFSQAKQYLLQLDDSKKNIDYQLTQGKHYLLHGHYELALNRLLDGYWQAIEQENKPYVARANIELATLYERRGIYDKALEHATAAGEFYEYFKQTKPLANTLFLIATIYEKQHNYNLALVHYFNALDQESALKGINRSAELRLGIARIYLQLFNYPKTEQYIYHARQLAQKDGDEVIKIRSQLLQGELEIAKELAKKAISTLQTALIAASRQGDLKLQIEAEHLLSHAFEENEDYYNALLSLRRSEQLIARLNEGQKQSNIEAFKQQQRILERALELEKLERQHFEVEKALFKQRNVALFMFCCLLLVAGVLFRRHRKVRALALQLTKLQNDYYTHPRSGLRNLRMLNARLANSLQQSSAHFEQWHLGEIIHEPLSDRLRFALFEVPLIKNTYLEQGYQHGLELERQFGEHLKEQVCKPARLYHVSDAMFLYIEPNARLNGEPKSLASSIQHLVNSFQPERQANRRTYIGMAEYPFLPRAYTAISDHELLDILLMAVHTSRLYDTERNSSQWTHFSAIDAAPAASFAGGDIRKACRQGIETGLIKVLSSADNNHDWAINPPSQPEKNMEE